MFTKRDLFAHWMVPASICATVIGLGIALLSSHQTGFCVVCLPFDPAARSVTSLVTFQPSSASELVGRLDTAWQESPLHGTVPNLAPSRFPPDMDTLRVEHKKRTFLRAVLPHVLVANREIERDRGRLLWIRERVRRGADLPPEELETLRRFLEEYRAGEDLAEGLPVKSVDAVEQLVLRIDVIPASLALAQAAIESGWGASRFAHLGNSLFGQWVFSADKGMAPLQRPEGADYAVARFGDLGQSVRAYMRNLNSFWAYEDFRSLRHELRRSSADLDPYRLASGLRRYSTRRDAYVADVRNTIRSNRLTAFDGRQFTRR